MSDSLRKGIDSSTNIVFFGGAGVSTESGIPDFRSSDGIYKTNTIRSPESILSNTFFMMNTSEFYDFYRSKMLYLDAKPNKAHQVLAELEQQGKLKGVITQNIDGLHQKAGSKNVLELHGSVHRNYCMECRKFYPATFIANLHENSYTRGIPHCSCGGVIKPDVVLYEEILDQEVLSESIRLIKNADILIVGGTSLAVYPAAGLLDYYNGHKLVLINKTATSADQRANLVIHGSIGEVLSGVTL